MRIGIDIDDVLSPTISHFLEEFNKNHDKEINYSDVTCYHFSNLDCEPHYIFKKLLEFQHDNLESFPIMNHAKETLKELSADHEIFIITARGSELKEKTINWIKNHFDINLFSEILFLPETKFKCKSDICKEYSINIMVEDAPHYAGEIANQNTTVVLMENPWNHHIRSNKNIIRVRDWYEVREILNKNENRN